MRERAVDQRAAALGEQSRKTERAAGTRRRAQEARELEQRRSRDVEAAERDRLEQGLSTAADLSQAADFARGAARRIAQRSAAEKDARERELREHAAEQRARAALARADAESQAIEKHRERWDTEARRLGERSSEEEALDNWNARARGKSGSN